MSMQKVKRLQHTSSISHSRKHDHNMQPLMTCTEDIESLPKPPLRELAKHQSANRHQQQLRLWTSKQELQYLNSVCSSSNVFKLRVTNTHFRPIRWLCRAQPYLITLWTIGMMDEKARLPKVAARKGRMKGSLNRGWKVRIEHAVANADS